MQPKPKPTPRPTSSKPLPTLNSMNIPYSNIEDIKIPVFITHNKIDRNDEVETSVSESDIGVIPYYHEYTQEDEEWVEPSDDTFNRLQLDNNQNGGEDTSQYKERNSILEINAEVLREGDGNVLEPYSKMEAEHGSWENGSWRPQLPVIATYLIIYRVILPCIL